MDFRASAEFDAGAGPSSVATADFNGDGHQDAAIASRSGNTLTILIGQGVKVFLPGPDAPDTGREPVGVLALDLNCDGKPDLVTGEATDFTVSTYLNDGKANFSVGQRFNLGGEPSALTIYDGACPTDAEPQARPWRLAIADRFNSRVVLLRYESNGLSFDGEAQTGLEPIAIDAGDVDRDGRTDLITADDVGGSISILYAVDDGFSAPRRVDLGGVPGALAIVDYDVDGLLDFGVTLPLENRIAVYHQGSDGTISRAFEDDVPARPSAIAMPDDQSVPFTGDRYPDLLVLSSDSALLSVYRGKDPTKNPPAPFEQLNQFTLGRGPVAFALTEFDRDASVVDLVVVNHDGESAQAIRGRAGGSFFAPVSTQTDLGPAAVVVGDFDGDGNGDTVTANLNASTVSFLKGNGAGSVRKRVDSGVGAAPTLMLAGEFTGDTRLDLLLASSFTQRSAVHTGNGDGTFAGGHELFLAGVPSALNSGDVDDNGQDDVAVSYQDQSLVDVFTDVRDSSNPGLELNATGPTADVALGDVNGDGTVDVVALVPSLQQLNVWYQTQSGSFDSPLATFSTQNAPTHFVLTDLNGDGQLDAVVASYSTATLGVMLARNGGFRAPDLLALADEPVALYAGDFNLDGAPDIAVLSDLSGRMTFLAGAGNGTFPENRITRVATGTQSQSFGIGQLNNDASRGVILPDVAVADYANDRVAILRNNTDVPAGNPSPAPTSTPRPAPPGSGGGGCDLPASGDGTALLLLAAAVLLAVGRGYWGGRRA